MGRICCVVCLSRLMILTFFAAKLIKNERRQGKNRDFVISVARDCHFIHEYPILEANVGAVR